MASQMNIEVGQRFRDLRLNAFGAPCRTVWVVDRVWHGPDGHDYAQLVRESNPDTRKTISTAALVDRRLYDLAVAYPQNVVAKGPWNAAARRTGE